MLYSVYPFRIYKQPTFHRAEEPTFIVKLSLCESLQRSECTRWGDTFTLRADLSRFRVFGVERAAEVFPAHRGVRRRRQAPRLRQLRSHAQVDVTRRARRAEGRRLTLGIWFDISSFRKGVSSKLLEKCNKSLGNIQINVRADIV